MKPITWEQVAEQIMQQEIRKAPKTDRSRLLWIATSGRRGKS